MSIDILRSFIKSLGPGIITGSSDDDPSAITTYSQAGAQFGFGMLWLVIMLCPLIIAIQEMCARIGIATGGGLAYAIKKKYSNKVVYPIISLLFIANTINIGADIGAMIASLKLLFPQFPSIIASISFVIAILLLEIVIPYKQYAKILRLFALFLLAYVLTALIVGGNIFQIMKYSLFPHVELNYNFSMMIVAIIGATFSPYLFFWQTSEEAEEEVAQNKIKEISGVNSSNISNNSTNNIKNKKNKKNFTIRKVNDYAIDNVPKATKEEIRLMRMDIVAGMTFVQIISWSIIITTAGSLHNNGITHIQTADQAANALEPLVHSFPFSGAISKTIFAVGIIGIGFLSIPVLAGSCGYVLADLFGWKQGLSKKFFHAKKFYLVITFATGIGLWITMINIDPIQILVYSAVINGIIVSPILVAILKIANDKDILKDKTNGKLSNIVGLIAIIVTILSVLIMLFSKIFRS